MRYLSLFSGIEAASVAWEPLGWECAGVAEVDAFASAVLAHRYPSVPNLGDVTKIDAADLAALGRIDLVVFGSPCQDLSVAGKREGLAGERSGLFHVAVDIVRWAREYCGCRWALWENVPGAFSSNKGRDFAAVVGELAGVDLAVPPKGWGTEGAAVGTEGMVEWAVLDAQWFGVAQRRRRVFALADFGDWASRPPVLLEPQSLRGDSPPSRTAGKGASADVAPSLVASGRGVERTGDTRGPDPLVAVAFGGVDESGIQHVVGTLCSDTHPGAYSGQDAYTGRLVPTAYSIMPMNIGKDYKARETDIAQPIMAAGGRIGNQGGDAVVQAVCATGEVFHTLRADGFDASEDGTGRGGGAVVQASLQVRRLTPIECEKLQGFPPGWTAIPYRGKPASDGPRYKALGNSMAIPVVSWIGRQIEIAESNVL
jgi:DNA (cytosine-5)-methyltransferase 1